MNFKTNKSEIATIFLVIAAIAVVVGRDHIRPLVAKYPPLDQVAPSGQGKTPGQQMKLAFPEPDGKNALDKSAGCKGEDEAKSIDIRERQFRVLVKSNGNLPLLFPISPGCLIKGHEYEIIVNRTDLKDDVNYYREVRGRIKIVKIESLKHDVAEKMPAYLSSDPTVKPKGAVTAIYGLWQREKGPETFAAPFHHPDAKTISADEAKAMATKGAILCDVRPKDQFAGGTLPNAISVEASNYNSIATLIQNPIAMKKRKISLNLSNLKAAKTDNVVVFSNNPSDFASYNAISLLAEAGYKNLFWLRGGVDESNGIGEPPEKIPGVRNLAPSEAIILQRAGAVFLDVRGPIEYETSHVPNAVNLPLKQKTDARGFATLKRNDLTAAMMTQEGESLPIAENNLNVNTIYVVYAKSEWDWRSFKAILLLKDKGFKKIFWPRTGLVSWMREIYESNGRLGVARKMNPKKQGQPNKKGGASGRGGSG